MFIHKDLSSNNYFLTLPFQIRDFLVKEGVRSVFLVVKEKDSSAVLSTDIPDGEHDMIEITYEGQLVIPGKIANVIMDYRIIFKFNQREITWSLENCCKIPLAGKNAAWTFLLGLIRSLNAVNNCQSVTVEDRSIVLETREEISTENVALLSSKMEKLMGKEMLVELEPSFPRLLE